MMGRADVEQAIVDDESMLEQVAGLLEGRADLAGWPEDLRLALVEMLAQGVSAGQGHDRLEAYPT